MKGKEEGEKGKGKGKGANEPQRSCLFDLVRRGSKGFAWRGRRFEGVVRLTKREEGEHSSVSCARTGIGEREERTLSDSFPTRCIEDSELEGRSRVGDSKGLGGEGVQKSVVDERARRDEEKKRRGKRTWYLG